MGGDGWLRLNRAVVTEQARLVLQTAKQETGVAGLSAWTMMKTYKLVEECWLKLNTLLSIRCKDPLELIPIRYRIIVCQSTGRIVQISKVGGERKD